MTEPPEIRQTRRSSGWTWSPGILIAAGGIGLEVLANRVANIGWVTLPAVLLVAAGAAAIIWQRFGARPIDAASAEHAPPVVTQPEGGSTTLPYTSGFTGRGEDVAWVVRALATEHAVAVVGRRGVGTSSCAVQAANVIREHAPQDQIHYLNLRPGGQALTTRQVITKVARAVGLAIPVPRRAAGLADVVSALRERLDNERILLVLNNVDSPGQVQPLLPPTYRCRLLLAGAPAVAGLDGVAGRWLGEPSQEDAVELFAAAGQSATRATGRQGDPRADPAVREIVDLCGRQPWTIRALGYRMARHGWRSADLLTLLRNAIAVPAHHRGPLAAVLTPLTDRDIAYSALRPAARRLFRLLSLVPVAMDRPAIGALADLSPARLDGLLEDLATNAFVVSASGDRYEVRPLLLGYARLHLRREDPARRRIAALTRLLRFLAQRAERHLANLAVIGLRVAGTTPVSERGNTLPLDDDPYGWYELHGELLRALVENAPGGGWAGGPARPLPRRLRALWFRLAVALGGWYAHEDRLDEWAAVCRAVLAAPTADDRPEIARWAHNELGVLRRRRGDPQGAAAALTLALAQRGLRGTAQAQMNLGLALLDLGLVDDATEHLELARRHRAHADRGGQALSDLALGAAYLAKNDAAQAHHYFVRAANTFRALGESRGYAAALTNLVLAQARLGEHLDAAQSWTAALHEYESLTDLTGRAGALLNAGAAILTSTPSRAGQAYDLLRESHRLRDGRRPDAGLGRTLLYLGDAADLLGRAKEAREHWADAAGVCEAVDDVTGAAAADQRLAGT